jgi:hypothetical protein
MGWKEVTAALGTKTTVSALKSAKGKIGKRKYRRLIATAVAELLMLLPDVGPRKARRRARRLTGARPSKKLLRAAEKLHVKEGAESLITAAAATGVAKVASSVGRRLRQGPRARRPAADREPESAEADAPSVEPESNPG